MKRKLPVVCCWLMEGGGRRGQIRCQYSFAPSVMRSGLDPTANWYRYPVVLRRKCGGEIEFDPDPHPQRV